MHLVDHGRRHIEEHYRRPLRERLLRRLLGAGADQPGPAARGAAPGAARQSRSPGSRRKCCARCWRWRRAACRRPRRSHWIADLSGRGRAAHAGRAAAGLRAAGAGAGDQRRDDPAADPARLRGRRRAGQRLLRRAARTISARRRRRWPWRAPISTPGSKAAAAGGLDAVVANASGCGTMLKDYGFLLRADPAYADKAARIAGLARDVSEVVAALGLRGADRRRPRRCASPITRPARCSTGRRSTASRKRCSPPPGSTVLDVPEGHLCCGSAGTYNILQPELAAALRDRKLANIALTRPDVVAAGNIGCITQLARRGRAAAGRAHGRTARLGDRRPRAAGPGRALVDAPPGGLERFLPFPIVPNTVRPN